jgi:flagellar biosynthesis protein FlhB
MTQPSHGKAIASLILGIIGVICWFFGYSSVVSIILGIIAAGLAKAAAKDGNTEGICTAGKILGRISFIGGIVFLILTIAMVVGLIAAFM